MIRFGSPKLWTNYQEVSEFARNRSIALDITIEIRSVESGWVLPYYDASWNGITADDFNERQHYDMQQEYLADVAAAFPEGRDEPTYGLSPMNWEK